MSHSSQQTAELVTFMCGECDACAHQRRVIKRLLDAPLGLRHRPVNILEEPATGIDHGVMLHPAIILHFDGAEAVRITGARSLRHTVNRILAESDLSESEATTVLRDVLDSPGERLDRRTRRHLRTAETRISALSTIPLLSGVPKKHLKTISRMADEVTFDPETVIFEEDAPGGSMMLLVDGTAIVKRGGRTIAKLGAGEVVGEMSVIDGRSRSATVETGEAGMVALVLEKADFEHLLDNVPGLARILMSSLSTRLREANRKLYG